MQKLILALSLLALMTSCHGRSGSGPAPVLDSTTVQLLDTTYDFGKATEGEKIDFSFRFKNVGTKPLIIQKAVASCGCTKPEWPQQPIPPGGIANIKAEFNSEGRVGPAHKVITVTSNASPAFPKLKLTGIVVPKNGSTN